MKKLFLSLALAASVTLGGCAGVQTALNDIQNVYNFATTATVPAGQAAIVANAFDALKGTAANYGRVCIQQKFVPSACSANNRRIVIKAINSGSAARIQLEASINSGQPAVSTIYNTLVAAVTALQASPIATVKSGN